MKNFTYIANMRLPTERAHGIQIMKMCESFAHQGVDVELVVPKRSTHMKEDPYEYYGVKKNFKITKVWCLDWVKWGWLGFWVETITFTKVVLLKYLCKKGIFYTRDEFMAFWLNLFGKKVIWEVHMGQGNIFAKLLIWRKIPMVVISRGLKDLYVSMGMPASKILVAPDGVDLKQFDISLTREEARRKLGLPLDKKLVVYTGSHQSWKGVETLEEASKLLPEDVEVLIISNRPYEEMPLYLKAADVLVLPNTAKEKISSYYTSPMKLFEYMSSGVPVIASNLPSIKEVLDETLGYFFEPDKPESLADVISDVIQNYSEATKRALRAKELIKDYTWSKRAENVLNFIK